jgi:hypothetical protein
VRIMPLRYRMLLALIGFVGGLYLDAALKLRW